MEGSCGTALIEVEQINKSYVLEEVTVYALGDISFGLYRGELIVILGPSGSGKNTLLSTLGGIETVTSRRFLYGEEELDWKDRKALTAYRRAHMGSTFQFYNLMPGLMAPENVELAVELGGHPLDVGGLMEQAGLADRTDHFPSKLSGGQQQWMVIARTLCKNPDTLLCDESTGALDSRTGTQTLKLLTDFNRAYQRAVVLITHSQKIAQIVRRIFYLKNGYLRRTG